MRAKSWGILAGLGLCWASEEMLTLRLASGVGGGLFGTDGYLYGAYLPIFSLIGLLFLTGYAAKIRESAPLRTVVFVGGLLGLLVMSIWPQSVPALIVGLVLFAFGAICLNYDWFTALLSASASTSGKALVCTAGVTAAATLSWGFVEEPALVAAVLYAGSYVVFVWYDTARERTPRVHSQCRSGAGTRLCVPLVVGICILMTGFGFLQYTAYHYAPSSIPYGETLAHLFALVLVAVVVFVVKDAEHVFAAKLVATLMMVAFVVLAVFQGSFGLAAILAEGAEGALELVVFFALAELAGYSDVKPHRLFGAFVVMTGAAQFVGCVLSIIEHAALPSGSYSIVGLLLVALIIVAAVWLLTDRAIVAFFWAPDAQSLASDGADTSFESKVNAVAEARGLTAREAEIVLLFARGRSSSFIAEQLFVSTNTVRSHLLHVYSKCGVHSRQELITMIDGEKPAGEP